jgi:2-methylcitrate dehydratase
VDAYQRLLASLGCAFRSLQDPDCSRLLGPVVPGATMTQGARVPGTSFELDPAVAAFNLGAMMGGVALAAILPVADYLARKAHNEAKPPLRMQDVFGAMLEARQKKQHWDGAAAAITCWLGGSRAQFAAALALDRQEPNNVPRDEPASRVVCGDAAACAVRLAFLAVRLDPDADALLPGPREMEPAPSPWQEANGGAILGNDFTASVQALFPVRQAALICTRVADQALITDMPVHEFIALLVRNG